jgi:hypothetical protein
LKILKLKLTGTSFLKQCSLILVSMAAFSSFSAATTVTTSVTCSSPGAAYLTNSASCYALGTEGYAQGGVTTSVSLPTSASGAGVISADSTASALETTIRGLTATATATASANIGITFDTTGPVRNGLLELTFDQLTWTPPANGYTNESLSVASYSVNPDGSNVSVWIPIQLGTDFSFEYQQSLTAISSGLTSGEIDSQISLLAFEANGMTPVQLYDPPGPSLLTPEPASIGMMMAAGVLGAAFLLKQRR